MTVPHSKSESQLMNRERERLYRRREYQREWISNEEQARRRERMMKRRKEKEENSE